MNFSQYSFDILVLPNIRLKYLIASKQLESTNKYTKGGDELT